MNAAVEVTCFSLQNIRTGVGPYQQTISRHLFHGFPGECQVVYSLDWFVRFVTSQTLAVLICLFFPTGICLLQCSGGNIQSWHVQLISIKISLLSYKRHKWDMLRFPKTFKQQSSVHQRAHWTVNTLDMGKARLVTVKTCEERQDR